MCLPFCSGQALLFIMRVTSARPLDTWQQSEVFQPYKNFKIHMLSASPTGNGVECVVTFNIIWVTHILCATYKANIQHLSSKYQAFVRAIPVKVLQYRSTWVAGMH